MTRLRGMGPGIVFVLSTTGARDLVSNSMAGAMAGAGLMWVLVAAMLARFAILEASARYVLVTGDSLMGGIGGKGRVATWLWFGATLFRRHAQSLVRLMLLGTAANFVLPLGTAHAVAIWGVASWLAGFALLFWGRYTAVERVSKWFAVGMGACLAGAAVLSRPDPAGLVDGLLHPVLPSGAAGVSPAIVLMSIISSAVGGFGNLNYSAYVHEKGWRTPEKMRMQRWDLAASLFGMLVMLLLIQTAAAGALRPRGLQVARVEDLIPIFSTVLGEGGAVLLGLLLWGVLFSSHVTGTVGNALMMTDVWYRFIRRTDGGTAAGHASERPFYRWAIVYMCLSPLYVFATEWTPVGLVLAYGVISILALPVIAGLICWLTADRRVMGEHRNGWLTNAALGFTVLAAVYLCWEGIGDVLRTR